MPERFYREVRYNNTVVNQLAFQAKFTLGPAARQNMWNNVTQTMYIDAAYAWIGQVDGYTVYLSCVHGVVWNPVFSFEGGGTLYKYVTLTC